MLKSVRVITAVRSAYNRYINSVLAAANQRVADANAAVAQASKDRQAIYTALFDVKPVGPSVAANDPR